MAELADVEDQGGAFQFWPCKFVAVMWEELDITAAIFVQQNFDCIHFTLKWENTNDYSLHGSKSS